MNYLRCHDDIGWGLDEAVEKRLGMDPQKHKEYLYHFYEGNFPGSWAKGELYNYDPATGDARSCGTTASLCGIEQALEKNDKIALDYAVKRDLLLHTAMAFLQGFPMLNCGDEIAQRNGWDYKNDPDRVEDSRNLHRSRFNWEDAKQRTQKGTLQNKLWQGMEQLRQMRADPCFAPDAPSILSEERIASQYSFRLPTALPIAWSYSHRTYGIFAAALEYRVSTLGYILLRISVPLFPSEDSE